VSADGRGGAACASAEVAPNEAPAAIARGVEWLFRVLGTGK
jgi:hypothetical protein